VWPWRNGRGYEAIRSINHILIAMNIVILKSPPGSDLESLELIMACAAFEQTPAIVLMEQGALFANKASSALRSDSKSISKLFSALPMYDCEQIYICEDSMHSLGMTSENIHGFCSPTSRDKLKALLATSKKTIVF